MAYRINVIQKIKSSESTRSKRSEFFDSTKPNGNGYLSEMSLYELNERFGLLNKENKKFINEKHDKLIISKIEKDENLLKKIETYK